MSKITETVWQLAEPVARENGVELWDVEFVKEAGTQYLRVYIDKPEGICVDDCEAVSRALDPILDEADPIPCSYVFEVASAGIDRELKRPSDFEKFMGSQVEIKLYQALNGRKVYVGELAGYDQGNVTVLVNGKELELKKPMIAQVRLYVEI
ncbi:MAG: ribosome maturation factor RimP [Oscillospiraceae bacterium]|nr:ribosome maturation factor RimP [Oscillospiraceae bacterium]MDD6501995.1 ribosome maturation factor RimP [Oscillospiraceae bacterium]MDY4104014.1 ribosome maturation factor RimP [Oscillospiraceae bacterium]